jgi:hypothetical protein
VNSEASFGAGLGVGRTCPLDYCYQPTVFARGADFTADVLYVVGGLYGNLAAIDELEALASTEQAPVTFVFNGDFHWFDASGSMMSKLAYRGTARFGATWKPRFPECEISAPGAAAPTRRPWTISPCGVPIRFSGR